MNITFSSHSSSSIFKEREEMWPVYSINLPRTSSDSDKIG